MIKAYSPKLIMGENLGYQTKNFVKIPSGGGIIVMTEEILTMHITTMSDIKFMEKYSFIVLDECHNRSRSMDLVMSLLKRLLIKYCKSPSCPFILITSATFDTKKYADYFGVNYENIITVQGSNYPTKIVFAESDVSNYIQYISNTVLNIHRNELNDYKEKAADIIVFVSGQGEVVKIKKTLNEENKKNDINNIYVLIELTSQTFQSGGVDYQNIVKPLHTINININEKYLSPKRRIILATNVAETGMTIESLKYILDTGYSNQMLFDPIYGNSRLLKKGISMHNVLQRKGRVSRVTPGVWYPLFTENTYKNLPEMDFPDIIISDITFTIFGLILKCNMPDWDGIVSNNVESTGDFKIESINLMDDISIYTISYSLEKLFILGLIDSNYVPTSIGLACISLRHMDLELAVMLCNGYVNECNINDILTIISFMLLRKSDYMDTKNTKYKYTDISCGNSHCYPYDDFIETIFMWNIFSNKLLTKTSITEIKEWCIDNGLVYRGFLTASVARDSILSTCIQSVGLNPFYNGLNLPRGKYNLLNILENDPQTGLQEIKKIKKSIYGGFKLNLATWNNDKKKYVTNNTNEIVNISTKTLNKDRNILHTQKIITRSRSMKKNKNDNNFSLSEDTISVMSNYADIDCTFAIS